MTASSQKLPEPRPVNLERWVRSALLPSARLALWLVFYLSLFLGAWITLGVGFGGWSPVVVTSGSMEPAVSIGDVLLIDTSPENTISQRSIVVFERSDGTAVAHRVFSVEGSELVTKGDANPSPDAERVVTAEVVGVARVLVPLAGLPAVWSDDGNVAALVAWAVLFVAGAFQFTSTLASALRHRAPRIRPEGNVGQIGIRRVRILVALLIVAQFVLDPTRFDVLGSSDGRTGVFLGLLAVLGLTNFVSTRFGSEQRSHLPVLELVIDTALVVFLSVLTGSNGLGWVLFALPIIEAAVRFGLVGAMNHWILLTTMTITGRVWVHELSGATSLLSELESTLDQMSVLFLVVVPGAYLAEQLLSDVAEQRRATDRVVARSALLEQVAESGRHVSQLDGQHIEAVIEGTKRLGFDVADLVVLSGDLWRRLDTAEAWDLPEPGTPASGVRFEDLDHRAMFVDGDHDAERDALEALGLSTVVTSSVASTENYRVFLRAGVRSERVLTAGEIDAFQLLAGQASVALQNHELWEEISSVHGELEHRAHHDALTGLPNRVLMLENLDEAVEVDRRPAVMFLDLDGFKPVNDRLGHDAGDVLLKLVAERLLAAAPRDSLVARVGGDEFTILLRGDLSEDRTEAVANTIATSIREPFSINDDSVRIGTSIGISFGEPGSLGPELIRRADVAMYVAKNRDGIAYEFYSEEFDHAELRRALLAEDLAEAMRNGGLRLVYQPVTTVDTHAVIAGIEALVRWTHPVLGPISPPEIVDAAKHARLGAELHRHISFEATRTIARWHKELDGLAIFLSINASPHDLASTHVVPNMVDAVAASGLDPSNVFVEISEELVSLDMSGVMENVHELNRRGIRMLLDDFGEGQTSISYIHELPVAGIKLDRKLVVNALRSDTDRIVIESIVELCGRLGLVSIAEGIESEDHLDVIKDIGCPLAQGFHLGAPTSGDDVLELLRAQVLNARMDR